MDNLRVQHTTHTTLCFGFSVTSRFYFSNTSVVQGLAAQHFSSNVATLVFCVATLPAMIHRVLLGFSHIEPLFLAILASQPSERETGCSGLVFEVKLLLYCLPRRASQASVRVGLNPLEQRSTGERISVKTQTE